MEEKERIEKLYKVVSEQKGHLFDIFMTRDDSAWDEMDWAFLLDRAETQVKMVQAMKRKTR